MNKYYHRYVDSIIDFLVPAHKRTLKLQYGIKEIPPVKEPLDYVVIKDVVAHVDNVQQFLIDAAEITSAHGRLVVTQYSSLWEPILVVASKLHLRMPMKEQNWLSLNDLKNFAYLAGLEVVKSGTKMIMPVYIPLVSTVLNKFVANFFPFSKLGIFHYVVLRKIPQSKTGPEASISIVVAARNEAGTIEKMVKELPTIGSFTELIFIEGNSSDNTWEEIQRVAKAHAHTRKIKYAQQDGRGKGDAVRKGFDMATGDILMIYDADMTVPTEELKPFYDTLVSGRADFVNGSRLVYPMQKESMRFFNIIGNKFFSLAFSAILGQHLKDTLCGTKVLWRTDYIDIQKNRSFFGDFDPFGDFDLLFGAAKLNLKIVDLPVHYKDRKYGTTNISRWSHGLLLLKMTIFAARKIKFI